MKFYDFLCFSSPIFLHWIETSYVGFNWCLLNVALLQLAIIKIVCTLIFGIKQLLEKLYILCLIYAPLYFFLRVAHPSLDFIFKKAVL